ncbi:uncharacterized protein LOC144149746 [Haemaphysalis longicornis]
MPYINERGEILESRPLWRIGTITEFFQGLARMVTLFFQTLFMMDSESSNRSSSSRSGGANGRGPPRPPPRRPRISGFGNTTQGSINCSIPGGG